MLIRAIEEDVALDIAWQTGVALAEDYVGATGDFKGLTVPIEDGPAVVTDDTYLVASHVASVQRAREPAATQASAALDELGTTAPSPRTPTSPAATTPQSPPGDGFSEAVGRTAGENSRVLGTYKSDFEDVKWIQP